MAQRAKQPAKIRTPYGASFTHKNGMAEREGFEPPVPCGTPDFESGAFDHSATSP
jgi:hypothetical protein